MPLINKLKEVEQENKGKEEEEDFTDIISWNDSGIDGFTEFPERLILREIEPATLVVYFPLFERYCYKYKLYLIIEEDRVYLSDRGMTYVRLNRFFDLTAKDVIENLTKILKRFGCSKQPETNAFIIDCHPENVIVQIGNLLQAISFMLNMDIFFD